MSRVRTAAALAVVVSLAFAGAAVAAFTRVTGGTTQITASAAAAKVLSDNHITVTTAAPATSAGTTFTFPIAGGSIKPKTLRGIIRHMGGLSLSNGTKTVSVRRLTIVSTKHSATIGALVRGHVAHVCRRIGRHHLRLRCVALVRFVTVPLARLTNVSVTNGTATAKVKITGFTAAAVNRLAGKHVVSAGAELGTATISPTLGS
jgi:hypothetical protein